MNTLLGRLTKLAEDNPTVAIKYQRAAGWLRAQQITNQKQVLQRIDTIPPNARFGVLNALTLGALARIPDRFIITIANKCDGQDCGPLACCCLARPRPRVIRYLLAVITSTRDFIRIGHHLGVLVHAEHSSASPQVVTVLQELVLDTLVPDSVRSQALEGVVLHSRGEPQRDLRRWIKAIECDRGTLLASTKSWGLSYLRL